MRDVIQFMSREVIIQKLNSKTIKDDLPSGAFVTLLPAYSSQDVTNALLAAKIIINFNCKQLCCVGPQSEVLHDELDFLVEDENKLDVVTTAFTNEAEACEYFLFAADAGQTKYLLALVAEHFSILEELKVHTRGGI